MATVRQPIGVLKNDVLIGMIDPYTLIKAVHDGRGE